MGGGARTRRNPASAQPHARVASPEADVLPLWIRTRRPEQSQSPHRPELAAAWLGGRFMVEARIPSRRTRRRRRTRRGSGTGAEHRQVEIVRTQDVEHHRAQVEERLDVEKLQRPAAVLEDPPADRELLVPKRLQPSRPLQVLRARPCEAAPGRSGPGAGDRAGISILAGVPPLPLSRYRSTVEAARRCQDLAELQAPIGPDHDGLAATGRPVRIPGRARTAPRDPSGRSAPDMPDHRPWSFRSSARQRVRHPGSGLAASGPSSSDSNRPVRGKVWASP